jgi:hypothetical protein
MDPALEQLSKISAGQDKLQRELRKDIRISQDEPKGETNDIKAARSEFNEAVNGRQIVKGRCWRWFSSRPGVIARSVVSCR